LDKNEDARRGGEAGGEGVGNSDFREDERGDERGEMGDMARGWSKLLHTKSK
jgi:hypothetical protein